MNAFFIMIRNVILFSALAIPGYLLVKLRILKQEQSATLSKILMYVGMPFLILSGTVNNLKITYSLITQMLVVALIGTLYTLFLIFISKPLMSFEKEEKTNRMMQFCSVFSNSGFLGLPLAIAVFGKDSYIFTVMIIINIITNIMLFTFGSYIISGDKKCISFKKAIINPVLIAFVIGITLNLLKIKNYIPEIVTYSDHFNGIVTPISMTILGMKLATVKLSSLFTSKRCYFVSLIKLIVCPILITVLLFILKNTFSEIINNDVIVAFFVGLAMPTAGLSSTFADVFNGDSDNAVIFTLGTTIISIITIPVLFGILNMFI